MKEKVEEAIKILDSAITLRLKNSFFELEREEQLAAVKKAYAGFPLFFIQIKAEARKSSERQ
jgi:hypothetical protein